MKIDWTRVLRTSIQAATGAALTALSALNGEFVSGKIKLALIGFVTTILTATLMNIKAQLEDE